MIAVSCCASQYASATYGFFARCFVLSVCRPVAIQPVGPSQMGWRMRANGRPSASTVETVHQTMRPTRSKNSFSMSAKLSVSFTSGSPFVAPWLRGAREELFDEPRYVVAALKLAEKAHPDLLVAGQIQATEGVIRHSIWLFGKQWEHAL